MHAPPCMSSCLLLALEALRCAPRYSPCNCAQDEGRTPLHCAAMRCRLEVARLLLECGADKEVKDKVRTPHRTAAAHCDALQDGASAGSVAVLATDRDLFSEIAAALFFASAFFRCASRLATRRWTSPWRTSRVRCWQPKRPP